MIYTVRSPHKGQLCPVENLNFKNKGLVGLDSQTIYGIQPNNVMILFISVFLRGLVFYLTQKKSCI